MLPLDYNGQKNDKHVGHKNINIFLSNWLRKKGGGVTFSSQMKG